MNVDKLKENLPIILLPLYLWIMVPLLILAFVFGVMLGGFEGLEDDSF